MDTTEQVLRATGQPSVRSLAAALEVPPATLNRQLRENSLALPTFVAICRGYKIDPVALLLDMGQFSRREAQDMRQVRGLDTYTDLELVGELYRRTMAASAGGTP